MMVSICLNCKKRVSYMNPPTSQPDTYPLIAPSRVLFAINDEVLRRFITISIEKEPIPYPFDMVASLHEARVWLAHRTPICIIMTVDIARGATTSADGLITDLPIHMPTVSLLQRTRERPIYPDYLYVAGAFHDYCMTPFSWEELRARIQCIVERANAHG